MERKKEVRFNPEKQVDFVQLAETLNWDEEIGPVSLVKAVNRSCSLSGRFKYETNEGSYSALIKAFEAKLGKFLNTRFSGKDRFYSLKPEYKKEQLVEFLKTGELKEIKEEIQKKDSKFYTYPNPVAAPAVVEEKPTTKKKSFPDDEALAKTIVMFWLAIKNSGQFKTYDYTQIREKFGWKNLRTVEKRQVTNYQEVNLVSSWLDLGEIFKSSPKTVRVKDPEKLKELQEKIDEIISLIDDEKIREDLLKLIEVEEPKKLKAEPTPAKEVKIIKSSPEVGKSEFKEIRSSAPVVLYEGSKVKWQKSLIASVLRGASRGTWFGFNDIYIFLKKTRYVEISAKEIKDILTDVGKQYRGIFSIDLGGVTVGSEILLKEFINNYPQESITETIFIRLKMSLEEFQGSYPELKVRIASPINESDNIFSVEMNRSEHVEKAFAKLVFRMRSGEIILESPSNWVVKRTKILIDKLQNF